MFGVAAAFAEPERLRGSAPIRTHAEEFYAFYAGGTVEPLNRALRRTSAGA